MVINHRFYMTLALKEAWKYQGLTYPNPAVGALVLDKNHRILSIEAHQKKGEAHAELAAIASAMISLGDTIIATLKSPREKHAYLLAHHDNRLKGATIYVTLEPCNHHGSTPPCASLIEALGFKRVICGSTDPNSIATGGLKRLEAAGIEIEADVLKEETDKLIFPFTKWQKGEAFIFFKLALSRNGVYDGGIITSKASRTLVHQMRDRIDLLVIGGETVRVDRPTLDSRLCGGKAPDVLILSREKEFDKEIPLFKVPNRKVFIEENLDRIKTYHFVMIEGGNRMLKMSWDIVDWHVIFTSSACKEGKTIQCHQRWKRLQLLEHDEDTLIWLEKERIKE